MAEDINRTPLQVKNYKVKIEKKKQNAFKFVISVLSYALFVWLILVGATLLIYVADTRIRAIKGDYSSPKFNAYVVLTGSMLPQIKVHDVVVTKKIDSSKLKVNDIITFYSSDPRFEGTTITHRIVNIYKDPGTGEYSFQTKGDNNNCEDMTLAKDYNVLGKVILKIPKLGYIQFFLAQKGGWIIAILIPCLAILSYDITKLLKMLGKSTKPKKLK